MYHLHSLTESGAGRRRAMSIVKAKFAVLSHTGKKSEETIYRRANNETWPELKVTCSVRK